MASGKGIEERRQKILTIINEELKESGKISKQYRHRKPRIILRMAELYLEKARLIKDSENKRYLAIPAKKRSRVNKKRFFSKSRKYFSKAQRTCEGIIRNFRGFKMKAEVYYILAFNAKEFGKKEKAKKYFLLSLRNSRANAPIYKKTSLALAEVYYNERNYKKSLPLYKSAISGRKDKWWTKDAYNMAWSYYERKQFPKAIDLMKEIYELSSNSKYIDMRSQVEEDIGLFYISANRLNEAIKFYRGLGKDVSLQIFNLGKVLMDRNKPTEAERVLIEAKKISEGEEFIDVNLTLLSLFQKYKNYKKHLNVSREIYPMAQEGEFEDAQRGVFIFQLKRVGGVLQKQVLRKSSKRNQKVLQRKAKLAGEYFHILAEISPKEKGKYLYLKAETYYAAKMMESALKAYQESFQYGKKKKNKKAAILSLEGMMAALAYKNLSGKIKERYHTSVYKAYLDIDRKSKKAEKIYQRIFQSYVKKKDFENSENVLSSYKVNFPKNLVTQEAMVARIMDNYRGAGNKEAFSKWVMKIKNKEYYVSKKYAKRLASLLMTMKFDGVEKSASSGDKKQALKGYIQIYNDSTSSRESRKNAAHNTTILYFELGYADETYEWANRSLSLMNKRDLRKFSETYLAISTELFNMQRFKKSAQLSERVYRKICNQKSKEKILLYKSSYLVYLASGKFLKANKIIDSGLRCNIPRKFIGEAHFEMLKVLGEQKKWSLFESHLSKLKKIPSMRGEMIVQISILRDAYLKFSEKGRAIRLEKEIELIYKKALHSKQKISVESLWIVAQMRLKKMSALIRRFNKIRLAFPQKKFDALLGKKINFLDKIATQSEKVFKTKSGRGSIKAYQLLIESYQKLTKELGGFKVVGKNKSYIKTFKSAMKQIETPLLKKSFQYLKNARKLIDQGSVLSPNSYWFISRNRLPIDVEYHFTGNGVLMDRKGKR